MQFSFAGEKPGLPGMDCPHPARVLNAVVVQPAYWPPLSGYARVAVEVTVGPNGEIIAAKIAQSSNSLALDQAALASVRASTFEPKTLAFPARRQAGAGQSVSDGFVCKAVSGSYLFRITYERS